MIDARLGRGDGLGQGEDRGAAGLYALFPKRGERLQRVHRARDFQDDLVGELRERPAHLQKLVERMSVDLDNDGLVREVEVLLDHVDGAAMGPRVLIVHDRVRDDASDAEGHPLLEVVRVAGEPDGGATALVTSARNRAGVRLLGDRWSKGDSAYSPHDHSS